MSSEFSSRPRVQDLGEITESQKFVDQLGAIYENSPWVVREIIYICFSARHCFCKLCLIFGRHAIVWCLQAERLFATKEPANFESTTNLAKAMKAVVDAASEAEKLALINSHPDLAGKAALAGDVTADSKSEQRSAGLNMLTKEELQRLTELNTAYKEKFGIVFILAVRNASKQIVLEAIERRLQNSKATEVRLFGLQALAALLVESSFFACDEMMWPCTDF